MKPWSVSTILTEMWGMVLSFFFQFSSFDKCLIVWPPLCLISKHSQNTVFEKDGNYGQKVKQIRSDTLKEPYFSSLTTNGHTMAFYISECQRGEERQSFKVNVWFISVVIIFNTTVCGWKTQFFMCVLYGFDSSCSFRKHKRNCNLPHGKYVLQLPLLRLILI